MAEFDLPVKTIEPSDFSTKYPSATLFRQLPYETEAIELEDDEIVTTPLGERQGKKGDMVMDGGMKGVYILLPRAEFDRMYETTEACFVDLCWDFDGCIHAYTSGWIDVDVIPDKPVQKCDPVALQISQQLYNRDPFSAECLNAGYHRDEGMATDMGLRFPSELP